MRINIIGFSSKGCALAERIAKELSGHECSCFGRTIGDRHGATYVRSVDKWVSGSFGTCGAVIFIGAAGIAVRHIAPYLKDKSKDPAVIVIDELGKNIIPVLSGHIGGANRLSQEIGKKIGGNAVITTATDINGVFSADTFAAENNMHIDNIRAVKKISARMLEGLPVYLRSEVRTEGTLPKGLRYADKGEAGIYISASDGRGPFRTTLKLIPRQMTIGIGCHRDIGADTVEERVMDVLRKNNISIRSVRAGASIDLKKDEKGLLEFFKKYGIPVTFFSAGELNAAGGEFTASEYVRSITGTDNVCERAAIAVSENGELLVRKDAGNGVTVAIAREDRVIRFGDAQ